LEIKNLYEDIPGIPGVAKKHKTKVVKKETDGWTNYAVVDEDGKELEKPKPEEKPLKVKQQPTAVTAKKDTPSNNIYTFADDTENLPTQSEYQASLRKNKQPKEQPQQPPKNKPRKLAENKENGEKPKEVENKKPKFAKQPTKKSREAEKKPQQQLAPNVPIWQNELIRPLLYVFVFVTVICVVYLVLN